MNRSDDYENVAKIRPSMLQRLDRFLLWLLTIEIGLVLLLGVLLAIAAGLNATRDYYLEQGGNAIIEVLPFLGLFLLVGYLVNLACAFWGLVLRLRDPQPSRDFPGTGHLFNWIYLFGLLGIVAIITNGF